MARNAPKILARYERGNSIIEVCDAEAVYAVFLDGQPIKIRRHNPDLAYQGYKYGKTSFPEPGHAIRLARELNEVFMTTDYQVVVLREGRVYDLRGWELD